MRESEKKIPFAINSLGGATQVTGSCHLFQANGLKILVDCGLSQGLDRADPINAWPVAPPDIDYVFLTHAHIDHIGRVPELIQKGFRGEIIATHGTVALIRPMLRDAMVLSTVPGSEADVLDQAIEELSWGFEYDQVFDLRKGIRFKFSRAGHILGSSFVRFEHEQEGWAVVFSGDLGAKDTPILPDPDIPGPCDVLVLESTYGDRLHEDRRQRIRKLGAILDRALSDNGKVFIPAFALGRAQELLYELDRLFSDPHSEFPGPELTGRSRADRNSQFPIPVFLDSPLGLEITKIYSELSEYWDEEAKGLMEKGDHPLDFSFLYAVRDHRNHSRLVEEIDGPCVILAGSGMCTGGRIMDHLEAGLADPRNDILFVGYQAEGTPGRAIMEKSQRSGGSLLLNGSSIPIRARVHRMTGYSAHADQKGLLEWVEAMPERPKEIRLVHGEPDAMRSLGGVLRSKGYMVSPTGST